jgi:hypothetical protein
MGAAMRAGESFLRAVVAELRHAGFDLFDTGIKLGDKALAHRRKALGEQITHGISPSRTQLNGDDRDMQSVNKLWRDLSNTVFDAGVVVFRYVKFRFYGIGLSYVVSTTVFYS